MNDQRRKQMKAKKAAKTAKRRAKAAKKVRAPEFDPTLPKTRAEIEAEMQTLLAKLPADIPARVDHHERGKTIHLSPTGAQLMRLRKQLFRVVFGREPGPGDPVFWDPAREHEGAFPLDDEDSQRRRAIHAGAAQIRPEMAYAWALLGFAPMQSTADLYTENDLDEWQEAVDDYRHQAATGVVPLVPAEFLHAWKVVNGVAAHPNVIPIGLAGSANTTMNRMLATLEAELGSDQKAAAAMTRMAALVALTEHEEFNSLVSPEGFLESAVIAAASAEIDQRSKTFDIESFRDRLDAIDEV